MNVLDKVKNLLSALEMATTKQVAEFYGVKLSALSMCVHENRKELESDGYVVMKGKDLVSQNNWQTKNMNGYMLLEDGTRIPYNKQGLFPKRAILRVGMIIKDGEPWFVARDVAEILGYGEAVQMTRYLDDDEKQIFKPAELTGFNIVSKSNNGILSIISESGLYSAVIRSRKPEVREFKRWVTHEVIPSIRKHGDKKSTVISSAEIIYYFLIGKSHIPIHLSYV